MRSGNSSRVNWPSPFLSNAISVLTMSSADGACVSPGSPPRPPTSAHLRSDFFLRELAVAVLVERLERAGALASSAAEMTPSLSASRAWKAGDRIMPPRPMPPGGWHQTGALTVSKSKDVASFIMWTQSALMKGRLLDAVRYVDEPLSIVKAAIGLESGDRIHGRPGVALHPQGSHGEEERPALPRRAAFARSSSWHWSSIGVPIATITS